MDDLDQSENIGDSFDESTELENEYKRINENQPNTTFVNENEFSSNTLNKEHPNTILISEDESMCYIEESENINDLGSNHIELFENQEYSIDKKEVSILEDNFISVDLNILKPFNKSESNLITIVINELNILKYELTIVINEINILKNQSMKTLLTIENPALILKEFLYSEKALKT